MNQADPRTVLGALIVDRRESFTALSRLLGRNAAYLQQFVKRGTPRQLAESDRRLLARYFGIEEALLGGGPVTVPAPTRDVRLLDIGASAGPGRVVDREEARATLPFDRAMLLRMGIASTRLALLRADGDSMAPGIEDGDQIMIDEADTHVGARAAIYVLRIDGVLLVKRLARRGDRVAIASDNPHFPAIPDRAADEIDVLGRVVWLSRPVR